jgi:hypothetical protein
MSPIALGAIRALAPLLEERAVIEDLLGGLDVTERPTSIALPGWTVHDVVAHLIGSQTHPLGRHPL